MAWGIALATLATVHAPSASAAPCSGIWTDAVEVVACATVPDDAAAGLGLRTFEESYAVEIAYAPDAGCALAVEPLVGSSECPGV